MPFDGKCQSLQTFFTFDFRLGVIYANYYNINTHARMHTVTRACMHTHTHTHIHIETNKLMNIGRILQICLQTKTCDITMVNTHLSANPSKTGDIVKANKRQMPTATSNIPALTRSARISSAFCESRDIRVVCDIFCNNMRLA